jgi:uncharacterized protein (DUF362 family)
MGKEKEYDDLDMDRRTALKLGAAASAMGILGISSTVSAAVQTTTPSASKVAPGHVVKVHKSGMRERFFPNAEAAEEMVNKAVTALSGETDLKKAWECFIKKEDRVGIKINALAGRFASTMKEVVDPIVKGVRLVGVPDENILIYDQYGGSMRAARFEWQDKPGKLRVMNHAVLGYEDALTESAGGGKGNLAKTLLWTTAVINVPVIKDHDLAGVTCAIKNMVCGSVEKPPLMHRKIHTALPNFYALDRIRGRVRLILCDGSFCLYEGGPKYNPSAIVSHDCIYATVDPAAMDAVALEVVDGEREKHKFKPLARSGRPATFLKVAEEIGLGISDRTKIRLETIELPALVKYEQSQSK